MSGGNSYNGWPASDSPGAIGIDSNFGAKVGAPPFSSGGFPGGVKSGDVSTIFEYLINRLHNEVEPMMSEGGHLGYGCWGYSYRANVNNPSQLSCHASGTAIDYNAPKHPNGTSTGPSGGGGWTGDQYHKVQGILNACSGAVRWLTSNDPMHFEIYGSTSEVASAAKKLGGTTPPQPKPPTGDWFDMATQADLEKAIDARMSFWLPRMLNVMMNGQPNQAFSPDANNTLMLNNKGLDGHMASQDNTLKDMPTNVWLKSITNESANVLLNRAANYQDELNKIIEQTKPVS